MGSFAISTTSTNDITGRIEWSESNVSIANNTSDLNVKLIYRMNSSWYATSGSGYFKITVNGVAYENNHYVKFASGTHEYTVIDHTFTITHDANGAKTVSIVLNNGYVAGTTGLSASSGSGTATLTTIARASKPSTTNGTFGSAITINTNRASSSFTHTLTMTMGSHSETKTGVGASLSWTIPASWADTIPTATSNTLSISCVTYNGSTNIGTKTTSCTATIPDSWKPSVSISKTLTNGGDSSQVIVSVTTVNLSASGSASTGTSISSYSWSGGAVSGTGASKTHSPSSAGTYTYTVTVTDRRGRTGTATTTATAVSGVSSFTCSASVYFGNALPVTISRLKSSFTHSVAYTINSSYTNTLTGQGTSASYTIPTSWAASVPAASSINMTVTVTTYNGSSSLGRTSKTVSVVVPSSWVPSFTLSAEAVSAFNSQYLKGVSKVKLTASSVSPSTGSQIASYSFTGNNVSKTASSTATSYNVTSDILSVVGSNTYTVKVTDKRGRVTTKTTSITVVNYAPPTLRLSVGRYTSGGASDSFGGYGRMTAKGSWTAVSGNSWTLTLKQKKKTASSYTTVNTWSSQTASSVSKTSDLFTADVDSAYDCQATLTDAVGKSITVNTALSTGKAIMDWFKDKVVGIFSTASDSLRSVFSNPNSLFYVGADKVALNGDIKIPDKVSTDGMTTGWFSANQLSSALLGATINGERVIPNNTDFNTLIYPGSFFVTGIARAETMTNMPSQTAGTLYVKRTNGDYTLQGQWQYISQEFHPFNTPSYFYKRYADTGDSTTVTWRAWKRVDYIEDGILDYGSLKLSGNYPKLLFTDSASKEATLISYNGANLWIGTQSSSNYQFRGRIYISAGWNGSSGNKTIYVAIPETDSAADYYGVHHDKNRLHFRSLLGSTALTGNSTVQFSDSSGSCDYLLVWCRASDTSTYGSAWGSVVIPTGILSGQTWCDGTNINVYAGNSAFPLTVTRSGNTYTLKRNGSSSAVFYVLGFCNP